MKPLLIDSHAHLCDSRLNADQIVAGMKADGLDKIITVGYDINSSRFNVDCAEKNKDVFATVGVHPSDAVTFKDRDLATLYDLAQSPKTVAIGEIGLDYHYDNTDKPAQHKALLAQLELVEQTGLPCVIHLRDAYEDMQTIIKQNLKKFRAPAVLHCFSGSKETALFYASLGFYISFTGVITYKNTRYADIVKAVPRDRLLIETDCPYLTPEPHRGKTNYPAFVRHVAERMAEIIELTVEETAQLTRQNTYNLFNRLAANLTRHI